MLSNTLAQDDIDALMATYPSFTTPSRLLEALSLHYNELLEPSISSEPGAAGDLRGRIRHLAQKWSSRGALDDDFVTDLSDWLRSHGMLFSGADDLVRRFTAFMIGVFFSST